MATCSLQKFVMQTTRWFHLRQEKQPTDAPACFQSWLRPSRISAVTKEKKKSPRLSFLKREAQSLFYQEQNPPSVTAVRWKH